MVQSVKDGCDRDVSRSFIYIPDAGSLTVIQTDSLQFSVFGFRHTSRILSTDHSYWYSAQQRPVQFTGL